MIWQMWQSEPIWMRLLQLASVWAVLCVGVCLPLITLKLYWKNISSLWTRESTGPKNWAEIQNLRAREEKERVSAKARSTELGTEPGPQAIYSTIQAADKYSKDDARFRPKT